MAQRQLCRPSLVEDYVGYTLKFAMSSDRHDRQLQAVLQQRINQDESFYTAVHQQTRIFLDQVRLAPMAGSEIEVALFNEKLFHPGEHLSCVVVVQIRNQYAD